MSEQQQQRVHFYHQDNGSSSSESRLEATHCPSMEASASVDQLVNIPTPPGGGSVDQMAAMHNALIPTPPGTATTPDTDRMEAIMAAMQSVAIPLPPAASAALPPQPLPISNLERMKMAVIPIPPSMAPAPNMDWLEQMHNATIPHAPSSRMEMMDAQPQPSSNTSAHSWNEYHPQQSTSTEVANSQRQPFMITGDDINQGEEPDCGCTVDFGTPNYGQLQDLLLNAVSGDMPTLDECQALEQAELAMSDVDDDFLCMLHTFKSQHGAHFPPSNIPYNKDLDGHIVQHVQAGQYMVDMIDLLEVLWHPHVGYSLQPYTREMAIVYLGCCIEYVVIHLLGILQPSNWPAEWYVNLCLDMKELDHLILVTVSQESFSPLLPACFHAYLQCQEDQMINQISQFIPNWMPRSLNKYVGFVFPWWVDRSPQYPADFQQMRGTRIFPIAHEYFQHTWPLQQLSMGD
ncbi:hypothetical protein EDD16DRAFT_1519059 [Pisolithus croceorrhizus]|nr:hypothetical protein EDD16DRAFT_1519059 [Pisolithus croceorrhizus]KAI6122095.1 hypothetical protein EV401DRAFT_1887319 [Pisolithus croceorrhizus]KAI6163481.1 hypothetical protein EDD17DRAFT_1507201 [Pisolithus thermaeus]